MAPGGDRASANHPQDAATARVRDATRPWGRRDPDLSGLLPEPRFPPGLAQSPDRLPAPPRAPSGGNASSAARKPGSERERGSERAQEIRRAHQGPLLTCRKGPRTRPATAAILPVSSTRGRMTTQKRRRPRPAQPMVGRDTFRSRLCSAKPIENGNWRPAFLSKPIARQYFRNPAPQALAGRDLWPRLCIRSQRPVLTPASPAHLANPGPAEVRRGCCSSLTWCTGENFADCSPWLSCT